MRGINAWIINKNRQTGEEKEKRKKKQSRDANQRGEERVGDLPARQPFRRNFKERSEVAR